MRKRLAVLLCAVLLCITTACGQNTERLTEEGRTTVGLYLEFVQKLESGTLNSTHMGRDSWYNAVTSESVTIHMNTTESGTHQLLYRTRTPFVFWYYPPFDYFDGENYFFKYGNDWFADRSANQMLLSSQDLFGIQARFFDGNETVSDAVYQNISSYDMEATLQNPDRTRYYNITAHCDLNFNFSKMEVRAYLYDYERQEYRLTDVYSYRFEDVNAGIPVEPPAGLNPADVLAHATPPAQN